MVKNNAIMHQGETNLLHCASFDQFYFWSVYDIQCFKTAEQKKVTLKSPCRTKVFLFEIEEGVMDLTHSTRQASSKFKRGRRV